MANKTRSGCRIGLIGHRGYPERYPENTIAGMVAAIEAGASGVEFDVQMTSDLVPVLLHDPDLDRTTDATGPVMTMTWNDIRDITAGEPKRFGDRFPRDRLPALSTAVNILAGMPPVRIFVEIKEESLAHFGVAPVMEQILPILSPLGNQCVVISFNQACLRHARDTGWQHGIGWVFEEWRDETREQAETLAPQYLFTDWRAIPEKTRQLWSGPWSWVLYDVTDAAIGLHWLERGATYLETWAMSELRRDLALALRVGHDKV